MERRLSYPSFLHQARARCNNPSVFSGKKKADRPFIFRVPVRLCMLMCVSCMMLGLFQSNAWALDEDANTDTRTMDPSRSGDVHKSSYHSTRIDPQGRIHWFQVNTEWYFATDEGNLATGWMSYQGKWYYLLPSTGAMAQGWQLIDDSWYHFTDEGALETQWVSLSSTWYFLGQDGAMHTGWHSIGGSWFYFNESGAMQVGWHEEEGSWYFFDDSGAMVQGWYNDSIAWYFFQTTGVMQTGWYAEDGVWYYLSESGALVHGWQLIDNVWYYFSLRGAMLHDAWVGWSYLDSQGAWVEDPYVSLSVPAYLQRPELPTGCESVALTNVLSYWGFSLSKTEIADNWMPRSSYDFVYAFKGDPHSEHGWAILPPGITYTANSYLSAHESSLWAFDISGTSFWDLYAYLRVGQPVVIWTSSYAGTVGPITGEQNGWIVRSGTHTVTLTGFDPANQLVRVSDPLRGDRWTDANTLAYQYGMAGNYAVVIR